MASNRGLFPKHTAYMQPVWFVAFWGLYTHQGEKAFETKASISTDAKKRVS